MSVPIGVSDVRGYPVETVSPETVPAEATKRCDRNRIGSVVVEDSTPAGTVTSGDVVRRFGAESDAGEQAVREFTSSPVISIQVDAPLGEAIGTMNERGISRLVALDEATIAGIVKPDDISHAVPHLRH